MTPYVLAQLAAQALVAADTLAGGNVFLPRDWPLNSTLFPAIRVQVPEFERQSRGPTGAPAFDASDTLELLLQLDGTDPGLVEGQIYALVDQVRAAMVGLIVVAPQQFSQIAAYRGEIDVNSTGERHTAEATLKFTFDYAEDWDAPVTDALSEADIFVIRRLRAGDPAGGQLTTAGPSARVPFLPPDP